MSNQQKFIDNFNQFCDEFDLEDIVSGEYQSEESEFVGPFELKDTDSDYAAGDQSLTAVYYFRDLDLFVMFEGYYASYDGTNFLKYSFVTPTEKTVTVYE